MAKLPLASNFTQDEEAYLKKVIAQRMPAAVIAPAFQRRFNKFVTPAQIQIYVEAGQTNRQKEVDNIKDKLPDHATQLEWLRSVMAERIKDSDITNNDLVNLAREMRQNITSSHQIATMNDSNTSGTQYVLVYGDSVVKQSDDAKTIDMEALNG